MTSSSATNALFEAKYVYAVPTAASISRASACIVSDSSPPLSTMRIAVSTYSRRRRCRFAARPFKGASAAWTVNVFSVLSCARLFIGSPHGPEHTCGFSGVSRQDAMCSVGHPSIGPVGFADHGTCRLNAVNKNENVSCGLGPSPSRLATPRRNYCSETTKWFG